MGILACQPFCVRTLSIEVRVSELQWWLNLLATKLRASLKLLNILWGHPCFFHVQNADTDNSEEYK